MTDLIEIRAFAEPAFDAIALYARAGRAFAVGMTFEELPEGSFRKPLCHLQPREAQMLMDSLWQAGLRPAAGRQSEGVVTAQDAHLQDMRAIAFAKLSIPTPSKGQ